MTSAPPKGGTFALSDPDAFHFVQRDLIAATVIDAGRASRLRTLGSNGTVNRLKEFAQGRWSRFRCISSWPQCRSCGHSLYGPFRTESLPHPYLP